MEYDEVFFEGVGREMEEDFPGVLFAFLFGSVVSGGLREESDIDLAIFVDDMDQRLELIPALTEWMERRFSGRTCDLVFLNTAGPLVAFEALKGFKLFVRPLAIDHYAAFYSLTCREYEDQIFWMKRQLQYRGYEIQWDY
jgi:predicted nucleotidyltransferase